MKALRVLTIVAVCAAFESAAAQEPAQPPLPPRPPQVALAPAPPQPPQAAPQPRAAQPAPQAPRPAPATPPAAPAPPAPPRVEVTPGQLLNIQVDVTLVVEGGTDGTQRKVITLTLADRQEGSVRSMERQINAQATLNVDARPIVQPNGKVLTRVGLEFQAGTEVPLVQIRAEPLLDSGKPLRISRAVSPRSDRSVTVEVTATVLK